MFEITESKKLRLISFIRSTVLISLAVGLLLHQLMRWSGLQDANWDLLNYHAYLPASLLDGSWFKHFHPAGIHSYFVPYLDLIVWPLTSVLPAKWGTLGIGTIQLTASLPILLSSWYLHKRTQLLEAICVTLVSLTGAMFVTEFGGTMGDNIAAIPALWGFALLLRLFSETYNPRNWKSWMAVGVLFGLSIALKLTMAYTFFGLLAVCLRLILSQRFKPVVIMLLSMVFTFTGLYAPWGLILFRNFGSPFFPMWNQLFEAPRYPLQNYDDARFGASSIKSLFQVLSAPFSNPNITSELRFFDLRWPLVWLLLIVFIVVSVVKRIDKKDRPKIDSNNVLHTAILFWSSSTIGWAVLFGIQRYAVFLELLALPLAWAIVKELINSRISTKWASPVLVVILVIVGVTVRPVDYGRRPVNQDPIIPTVKIYQLAEYDAIVLAAPPLAHLYALVRGEKYIANQIWFSLPFNEKDAEIGREKLQDKRVAIISYESGKESAIFAAESYGLSLSTCQILEAPLRNSLVNEKLILCDVKNPISTSD